MLGSIASAVGGDIGGAVVGGLFNAREASKNRSFQKKMANTSYQRAAKDLEAAGLNRVLALGQPAATPAGATAAMESPKLGSTGIAAASAKQAIAQGKALESATKAQETVHHETALKTRAETAESIARTRLTNAEAEKAEITKGLYEALGPSAEKIFENIGSAAADFIGDGKPSNIVNRVIDSAVNVRNDAARRALVVPRTLLERGTQLYERGINWWRNRRAEEAEKRRRERER